MRRPRGLLHGHWNRLEQPEDLMVSLSNHEVGRTGA